MNNPVEQVFKKTLLPYNNIYYFLNFNIHSTCHQKHFCPCWIDLNKNFSHLAVTTARYVVFLRGCECGCGCLPAFVLSCVWFWEQCDLTGFRFLGCYRLTDACLTFLRFDINVSGVQSRVHRNSQLFSAGSEFSSEII